ncbi:magnesium-protoporphyrin IX monomethyl ester anaerobic oxidative cyclase [Diaphorobacter sp. HDW4B]|uniref:magnesium-protoporphyrin IX monomethyl ester anaerobic oxidative cyclase n=1 Tax=Diaphorobacter sp. HDW4B TaxID=2714925 RepID=UPI0014092AAB|nr:magnesium-protoporphyrin IX monomethyl ester anaerobic oxidative cyclase [Diaphorobacter sp. HDW4B]QIL71855.1 magnesium-protoporphyrin IX monomethyl ester anaerobic oxidative cyclase [Diaphorobacter sp. HDW4B]
MQRITLINPPHTAIGSRMPREHLPPLGLLSIGGPLIDHGFDVRLIDAEFGPMSPEQIVEAVREQPVDVVMLGHSGSSSAHVTVVRIAELLKRALPDVLIVYGGVHPTYMWDEILRDCHAIDFIVRGEGEQTALDLMRALRWSSNLSAVSGIAYRVNGVNGQPHATPDAPMIRDLDAYRVGWELIDHARYSYWGGKRAVVVQFSRGCPHLCTYCGQRGFWTQWRHRDPVKFAKELARLHREQGVELINFADELPTGSRRMWLAFLNALIAEDVPLLLVGSTRAGDIVRDRDILHLYRKAGVIRFLLGIESYSDATLAAIGKGATMNEDQQAIALLREHGIVSMATYVVGFSEERDADFWRSFRHLVHYDPDQIQLLYATPHRWTPFYDTVKDRQVVQKDTRRWDYKHQVLANPSVPAWRVFLWFKLIEVMVQMRPKVLQRMLAHRDADYRHAMRWYTRIGRRVWMHEVLEFLFLTRREKHGPTLEVFAGKDLSEREYVLAKRVTNAERPSRTGEVAIQFKANSPLMAERSPNILA